MLTLNFIPCLLAVLTSIGCTVLLLRGYWSAGLRLLLSSALCFVCLSVNNLLLFLDLVVFPDIAAPLKVLGLDGMSCAAWTAKVDPELRQPYIQWVRGFLSGHNYATQSRQVAEVSSGTVENFIDRYCREHARATVTEAAMR